VFSAGRSSDERPSGEVRLSQPTLIDCLIVSVVVTFAPKSRLGVLVSTEIDFSTLWRSGGTKSFTERWFIFDLLGGLSERLNLLVQFYVEEGCNLRGLAVDKGSRPRKKINGNQLRHPDGLSFFFGSTPAQGLQEASRHKLIRASIAGTWDTAEDPRKACGFFWGRTGTLLAKEASALKFE